MYGFKFKVYIDLQATMLLRGIRDIGWEHAVDLDGNKRRWKCKWCSLCRSGGVTTLKAHLTDSSCPNIPKEISKKVLNFIEEKRAARHLFNSAAKSPFNVKFDEDAVNLSEIQVEGTPPLTDDRQPLGNSLHIQTSECTINEVLWSYSSHILFFRVFPPLLSMLL